MVWSGASYRRSSFHQVDCSNPQETKESKTKVVNQMTASFIISPVKPTPEVATSSIRSNAYNRQEAVDGHRRANFEAEGSSFKPLVNHHQRLYKGIG